MSGTVGTTAISPTRKYELLIGLEVIAAVLTYLTGHPELTEATLIGAGLTGATFAIQELEA